MATCLKQQTYLHFLFTPNSMYVSMYVCMYACMYVYMYVHVHMYMCMYDNTIKKTMGYFRQGPHFLS